MVLYSMKTVVLKFQTKTFKPAKTYENLRKSLADKNKHEKL